MEFPELPITLESQEAEEAYVAQDRMIFETDDEVEARQQEQSNDHELTQRNNRIDAPEFYIIKANMIGNQKVKIEVLKKFILNIIVEYLLGLP